MVDRTVGVRRPPTRDLMCCRIFFLLGCLQRSPRATSRPSSEKDVRQAGTRGAAMGGDQREFGSAYGACGFWHQQLGEWCLELFRQSTTRMSSNMFQIRGEVMMGWSFLVRPYITTAIGNQRDSCAGKHGQACRSSVKRTVSMIL